jgi:hypothetical protein
MKAIKCDYCGEEVSPDSEVYVSVRVVTVRQVGGKAETKSRQLFDFHLACSEIVWTGKKLKIAE